MISGIFSLKTLLLAVAFVGVGHVLLLTTLGFVSRSQSPPALTDGELPPCPGAPNCVSSRSPAGSPRHVAPIPADGDHTEIITRAQRVLEHMGARRLRVAGDRLAAEFRSPLFGLVDDLELQLDRDAGLLHLRSASRTGHYDLGVNRRRVERFRQEWAKSAGE